MLGNNGVLSKSQEAVTEYEEATVKEDVLMAWSSCEISYESTQDKSAGKESFFTPEKLNESLAGKGTVSLVKYVSDGESAIVYKTDKNNTEYIVKIDTHGNVYIESDVSLIGTDGNPIKITSLNLNQYLGKKVDYTPASSGKITLGDDTSPITTSTTYRLFYIDFEGKYGDRGTIYLKADWANAARHIVLSTNSTENNKYLELNPMWRDKSGATTTLTKLNLMLAAWLSEPNIWKSLKSTSENLKDKINYVVGAPSLDMYIDSYNIYLSSKGETSYKRLAIDYVTDETTYGTEGYIVGLEGNSGELIFSQSNDNSKKGYWSGLSTIISYSEDSLMYNPGGGKYYWLASPSACDTYCLMLISGNSVSVNFSDCRNTNAICPLVSIQHDAVLTLKK
jgi:hypothetical protein